jgi:iron only hydrogenase large subunit-like protein
MIVTARVLHALHGPALKVVFIGPCIAKKGEMHYEQFDGEVHAALTYTELRGMLAARSLRLPQRGGEVREPQRGQLDVVEEAVLELGLDQEDPHRPELSAERADRSRPLEQVETASARARTRPETLTP